MRVLERNKQTIYYSLFVSKTEKQDANGNKTGTYNITYTTPKKMRINVSSARGTSDMSQFGITENYSKTMVTDDVQCPIDENSILWIDLVDGDIGTYSSSKAYAIGELCIYNGKIYKCKSATSGTFVQSKWENVPHNYCITRVAKSLNSIVYAIKGVNIS